jgi:16S rRNA (guanine527-N7)-methyltransferase
MTPESFAEKFNVSRETLGQMMIFQALLGKWQQRINLVGPATLDDFWSRHAADSAQIVALAPKNATTWLDLGSGGGFPGLVLAMMLAPRGGMVHLVESDERKVAFLRTVIRETGAPAQVHLSRIEALAAAQPDFIGDIQVITARALAALPKLLPWIEPFTNSSTIALLHKGGAWEEELTQAQQSWTLSVDVVESVTEPAARILKITQLMRRA